MFFLIRSAGCICVVAMLATGGDGTGMGRLVAGEGRGAVQSLGRACMASSECLRLGMDYVASMGATGPAKGPMPDQRSHDTLTTSDLAPAWGAPGGRRADTAGHRHTGGTLARL